MPGSNEVVLNTNKSGRMELVLSEGARIGKKVVNTVGQLGAFAVVGGVSQFGQMAGAYPVDMGNSTIVPANSTGPDPRTQGYVYGAFGLIGAMVVTVVFIFPVLRRLLCSDEPLCDPHKMRGQRLAFATLVEELGKKPEPRAREIEIPVISEAPRVVDAGVQADAQSVMTTQTELEDEARVELPLSGADSGVRFSIGSRSPDNSVLSEPIERLDFSDMYAFDDAKSEVSVDNMTDESTLIDPSLKKRHELSVLQQAEKIIKHIAAHPERAEEFKVKYRRILEKALMKV